MKKDVSDFISSAMVLNLFNYEIDIDRLQADMKKLQQVSKVMEPRHIFSGGVYLREVDIPMGTLAIGKRHRRETCNILMKGSLVIYAGGGKKPVRIDAPFLFTSEAGTKKVVYALEDCTFITIHPTSSTDLDEIEKEFITPEDEGN
jgi:hypothetical protein